MIVGTAGHIDHGKTSLVKAITGIDADRLREEKERGITIDLGFAYWPQDDGSVVGFVDVPGHERLVHTMLAGAHGIDRLLLVVAADDGVMPQTREHLEIATLLGLDRGAVALTKIDAVAPERVEAAMAEVAALLDGTPLSGSPVFPLSSLTGEGLPALVDWLRGEQAQEAQLARRTTDRLFRLAVDRSFVLKGAGVVVTGMALDGTVAVGDEVVVAPNGLAARVRALHAQNRPAERAQAGERIALNIAGPEIAKEAIRRGDVIVTPNALAPTTRLDVAVKVASGAPRGLSQWMPARLHHASAEVGARIVLLDEDQPLPGQETRVQLVLDAPIQAQALDRVVLRDVSASRTLAGGLILDLRPPDRRRRAPERRALLSALAESDPVRALAGILSLGDGVLDLAGFARDRGVVLDRARGWCEAAGAETVAAGRLLYALPGGGHAALREALLGRLGDFHAEHPDLPGLGLERLRQLAAARLPVPLFRAVLRGLLDAGEIAVDGAWIRLATHSVALSPEDEALWGEIAPLIAGKTRFRPPRVRDLAGMLGQDEGRVRRAMRAFSRAGRVHEIARDHYLRGEVLAEAVRIADAVQGRPQDWFSAAAIRDRLEIESGDGVGRKVAIQLLEFFDRLGVTIRRGDLRRVNPHRRDLFEARGGEDEGENRPWWGGRTSNPVGAVRRS